MVGSVSLYLARGKMEAGGHGQQKLMRDSIGRGQPEVALASTRVSSFSRQLFFQKNPPASRARVRAESGTSL